MTTTNNDVQGFFAGIRPKKASRTVIPVNGFNKETGDPIDNGAPEGNMYLFRYTNPRTGLTAQGAYEGSPYMSFQAEVVKPDNFAGKKLRVFMGIFRKDDAESVRYNVQQIGGEDVVADLPSDAGEAFEKLAEKLDGEEFVGRVGLGYNKKEQRDEVRIYDYFPASEWLKIQSSTGSGW